MVRGEVREAIFHLVIWISVVGEWVPVAFGVGGVAAEMSNALELTRVLPIRGVGSQTEDSIPFGDG